MSRVGRMPIDIPAGVTATLDGQVITVKGPKGEVNVLITKDVSVSQENGKFVCKPLVEDTPNHGTTIHLLY